MNLLKRAKKIKLQGQDWQLIKISSAREILLQKLSLLPKPEESEKRKPGRSKNQYSLTLGKHYLNQLHFVSIKYFLTMIYF